MRRPWIGALLALVAAACLAAVGADETGEYAGVEMCSQCHEETYQAWLRTAHRATLAETDPARSGCEACHGPGGAHAESGGDPELIVGGEGWTGREAGETCLGCHRSLPGFEEITGGTHWTRDVACTSCHAPHPEQSRDRMLKAPASELCGSCHAEVRARFQLPYRHDLESDVVGCADCHDPHAGKVRPFRRTSGRDEACLACHAELRGPFAFEHVASRVEGCGSCHEPHGSFNPRLLVRSRIEGLCLECHVVVGEGAAGTPAFHDQSEDRWRECTICHTQIHGSNLSPFYLE